MSEKLNDTEIKSILAEYVECGIVEHNIASVDFIKSVLELIDRLEAEKEMEKLINAVLIECNNKLAEVIEIYKSAFKRSVALTNKREV